MQALILAIGSVLTWFAYRSAADIAFAVVKWIAVVALVKFVVFVALGAAIATAMGFVLDFALTQVQDLYMEAGIFPSASLQLTGLAAYIGNLLRLPECMTIMVTGWSFRFVRQVVPFM